METLSSHPMALQMAREEKILISTTLCISSCLVYLLVKSAYNKSIFNTLYNILDVALGSIGYKRAHLN